MDIITATTRICDELKAIQKCTAARLRLAADLRSHFDVIHGSTIPEERGVDDLKRLVEGNALLVGVLSKGQGLSTAPTPSFRVLASALHPGDRLSLRPGIYDGPVTVQAGVSIIGCGSSRVTIQSAEATIPVVTLCGAEMACLSVVQASPLASAVYVSRSHPDGDCAEMRSCKIVCAAQTVVRVAAASRLKCVDCDVQLDCLCGLAFDCAAQSETSLSDVRLHATVDHDTRSVGVRASHAVVDAAGCEFEGFGTGLQVSGSAARPSTVSASVFTSSSFCSIDASELHGHLHVVGSRLQPRDGSGIWLGPNCSGRVQGCHVSGCGLSAVVLSAGATADITDNDLVGNGQHAVRCFARMQPEWTVKVTAENRVDGNGLSACRVDV